ncbi:acyl carrier protein [Corynebacterium sp. TA-R-1]|uniref:Acyl carrier protein n=1 Tax=Corynebacterium stercoris TaxID=2943490 RepID=A0ABT1FYG3_9CORY|nr:acyl carrier protein [Corynebacterium stercoris]MCP1386804.1 acyl carrier protein [Corynebacterium stercoris]
MELSQRLDLGEAVEVEQPQDAFARLSSLIDDSFNLIITPEATLADSGLSSLDRIELAIRIEDHFGVPITEETYEEHTTAGDLADYLAEQE